MSSLRILMSREAFQTCAVVAGPPLPPLPPHPAPAPAALPTWLITELFLHPNAEEREQINNPRDARRFY